MKELPTATAREWLRQFRSHRAEMAKSRGDGDYCRWRSNAHQCQLRVSELRAANPRKRRSK